MRHLSVTVTTAAALLLAAASPAASVPSPTTVIGDVQKAMEKLAATPGVVGAVGGVYLDGKSAGRGTAGSRLLGGNGGTIPADSRFRIGSQTKTMVGTVLLQLVNEGRVGLDDKLARLLPEVAAGGLVERAGEITVRQLVQHTSGVPDWYSLEGSSEPAFDVFDFTAYHRPIDIVKMTRGRPRTGEPGEKFTYSNTGYTLLGMIIEKVTGHALARELDQRLFRPLGMTRTYQVTGPPEGIDGPHGHGYYPDAGGALRDVDRFNASWGNGAGGVVSTTQDVSRFHRAFYQGRLLPSSLRDVLTGGPRASARTGTSPCGDLKIFGGSAPGYVALTFASTNGREQIAVSVTHSAADDGAVIHAAIETVETAICPAA
ncbi:MAG: serine hydrolase domain-containing protein [Umezawaea sp.]